MKAAVFYEKHKMLIEELPMPEVKDNEVLINVKACGICGTDVHIFDGDEGVGATPPGTVLGHEFAGLVVKTGSKVSSVKEGDKVCVDPNKLCNECYWCKSGIGHFCDTMTGIGTMINGGFAEYCVVPESQVYKFSDRITFEQAAMTEPVACCLHGIDMCDINAGDSVMVIGGGMIGLIMLQLAKLRGAARLVLVEPVASKRELGLKLGADLAVDPITEDVKKVLSDNGISRLSTVIECVGKTQTMKDAIEYAGLKSTVMLFGLCKPGDTIDIKPFEIFKKEIVIKASFINPYTQRRALDLIDSGKVDVSSMIYKAESLDNLPAVLADGEQRKMGKFIIKP